MIELSGLLDSLQAAAPSPAGGTAAAIVGAMAASLVVMVGHGSPSWPDAAATAADASRLRDRLQVLGEDDVRVFATLLRAYSASRAPDAGDSASIELIEALLRTAEVPLEIAAYTADVAELAARAATHGKRPMRPDAEAAAILAEAATRAASLLVRVNLRGVRSDLHDDEKARLSKGAKHAEERARDALSRATGT